MVQEYHTGDEPIPGYRLSKFLGRGGFGEVWQAVAPGRTEVALKIIALDRKQGMKEFRSLRLVKRIRHPNLVPILAFWLKDADGNVMDDDSAELLGSSVSDSQLQGKSAYFNVARADQLVIAMGLGDKNLLVLLEEYQAAGRQGIPEDELLDYMEGSARAIDFLNSPRHDLGSGPVAIQHCDIKPQNIMIVGDAVQLCDFGLARSLTDVRSTSVAGSIAYGAPELFWENKPSAATDQYSLAISYYELRTGELPFGPEMAHLEVMQAHRDGTLDFNRVGDAERNVLVRATAPSPAARFDRTIDMVRALRRAVQSASQILPAGPRQPQPARSDTSLLVTGREIVPGYTLAEHLFHADAATDVWSATGAGNKPLSLWIYDLSRAGGLPDAASLRMAQAFAHPQFARLVDFWLQDAAGRTLPPDAAHDSAEFASCSRLIVASDLARTNLAHRLEECRQTLGTGIPQSELLGYLRPLAGAIDALNEPRHARGDSRRAALLHCDLRPANLLLFHSEAKIGNLAWVRALESDAVQLPGRARRSLRPFAGPEWARDRLTRWSDQYALAASYIVLRTGIAAGDMPSAAGLSTSASSASLDLSKLPPAETAVLTRALNPRPEQRFDNCCDFVAALEAAAKQPSAGGGGAGGASGSPAAAPGGRYSGTIVSPSPEAIGADEIAAVQLGEAEPAASISETAPEHDVRRSTLIEPFGAAAPEGSRKQSRRGLQIALAAAGLAAALGALFLTGDDARQEAERLAAAGEYQQAIESLDVAPWWRSWRVDRAVLRGSLMEQAKTSDVAVAPEKPEGEDVKPSESDAPAGDPQQLAERLLDEVDGNLETGQIGGSEQTLERAEAEIAKLPDDKGLRRRLSLARAQLAVRQRRWDEAEKLLAGLESSDFTAGEVPQRGRLAALRALTLARFDGGTLTADVDLRKLAQAIVAAPHDDPGWKNGKRFRIDADRLNKLAGQVLLKAIDLAYREKPDERRLAGEVMAALAADFVPAESAAIQARVAAAETHLLLAAAERPNRDAVVASLAKWRDRASEVGRQELAAAARDLSRWATGSRESGAMQAAIAALSELRGPSDEARTEYAGLLIEQLAREAALAAPDWGALAKLCQGAEQAVTVAGAHPRLSFVRACRAECALETPDQASQAAALISDARLLTIEAGDRAYLDYVDAVARVGENATAGPEALRGAAELLESALAEPAALLEVPRRKSRAAETLAAAAARLAGLGAASQRGELDPPAVTAKDADEIYRWAQLAAKLSPAAPDSEARLALVVAALRKTAPDEAEAKRLAGELVAAGRREAWLLVIQAHEVENSQPAKAAVWYAAALEQLDLNALAGETARKADAQVVEPGLALAKRSLPAAGADAATRQAVAKLYAAKGRLIRANATLVAGGQSPDEQAFLAFDGAIQYDGENPEWYVERGYARWAKEREDPKVVEPLQRDDIDKAIALAGGKPSAAALGLRGTARLQASRNQSGAEQLAALAGAIEDYKAAIAASDDEDEHYSDFLDGAASTYVELANFSTEGKEQFREFLEKAIALARESSGIEYRPNPEFAWLNLGNAEEDMIWRVHDYGVDHYCRAINAFRNASAAARNSGRPPEFALYCEGRCRSKLVAAVLDGKIDKQQTCDETIDDHIDAGLEALSAAAENLEPANRAEAHYWRARLFGDRARTKSDAKQKQTSLADADAALKAALDAIDQRDPSWGLYQQEYVLNAWDMQRFDEAQKRGLVLLDSTSPSAAAERKGSVVYFVASAYARSGDAKRGLQEYQTRLDAPEFRDHPDVAAELLVSRGAYILENGLWAQSKQLCESSARDAIKLAQEARARGVEAQAWIVLYEHLLRAHPTATSEQLKECSAALAKAISLGLKPATHRSRSILLAQINLQLAGGKLPLPERIQFAKQGLKAIEMDAVSGANAQQLRVIDKLRTDLQRALGELTQQALQPAQGAGKPAKPAADGK